MGSMQGRSGERTSLEDRWSAAAASALASDLGIVVATLVGCQRSGLAATAKMLDQWNAQECRLFGGWDVPVGVT